MKNVDMIIKALENLGGKGCLDDIYKAVEKVRGGIHGYKSRETFTAGIRGNLERHSSDSSCFAGNDLFYSVNGIGSGVWGLRK